MTDERVLFDRSLLRKRRARFAHEIGGREFLIAHVAREIAERVGIMLREFPRALDLGAYHGLLGRTVAALPSPRGGSIASHFARTTFCWFPPLRFRVTCSRSETLMRIAWM